MIISLQNEKKKNLLVLQVKRLPSQVKHSLQYQSVHKGESFQTLLIRSSSASLV